MIVAIRTTKSSMYMIQCGDQLGTGLRDRWGLPMTFRIVLASIVLGMTVLHSTIVFARGHLLCPVQEVPKELSDVACPCQEQWKPTPEQLKIVLAGHQKWLEKQGTSGSSGAGPAILCNANLRGAYLFRADLRGAILEDADLQRANLIEANFQGANLFRADLNWAKLSRTDLQKANLRYAKFRGAYLDDAELQGALLEGTNFERAILIDANLQEVDTGFSPHASSDPPTFSGANLRRADLQMANLGPANLQKANLSHANLKGTILDGANLKGVDLVGANLTEANLFNANLMGTLLDNAILKGATLIRVNVENASLAGADFEGASYAPASPPPNNYLVALQGLQTVTYPAGLQSGLVQLRTLLQKSGLRDLEREVTYAIEHNKARHDRHVDRDILVRLGGYLRLIFFEWTTAYGLSPIRSILIMFCLIGVFSMVYFHPIQTKPERIEHDSGIYRIWPAGRITYNGEMFDTAKETFVERVNAGGFNALWRAFQFSVISAFNLGWRDLNIGSWISHLQPREYTLRAKGWVRVVSGIQSLLSVYLLAIWALTHFGRPFQ